MDQIFSTVDVHPRDRFDYWHEVACKSIVGHQSRPKSRFDFEADLRAASVADIRLLLFQVSPMDVASRPRDIAQPQCDDLMVCRQIAGKFQLDQDGREVVLQANDFCLLDPLLPHTGTFSNDSRMLVLKINRRALEARIGKTFGMTARALGRGETIGGLTSGYLAMLPAHAGKTERRAEELIREQAIDLVAMSLAAAMNKKEVTVSSARGLAVLKLRTAVETRLADPTLDPSAAAGEAGISVRYANKLLAQQGTSLERFIQTRRLERCRRLLGDPSQAHRTLTDISFAWGFSDLTHFGRIFKKTYGVSPSEYRGRAMER